MCLCLNAAPPTGDLGSCVAIILVAVQQFFLGAGHDARPKARELWDGLPTKVPTMGKMISCRYKR